MTKLLTGVVGILTDETGRPIATVSDFDRSTYGGMSLTEGQRMRAQRDLALEALRVTCNSVVASVIDTYRAQEIVQALCSKKGWRQSFIEVSTAASTRDGGGEHG